MLSTVSLSLRERLLIQMKSSSASFKFRKWEKDFSLGILMMEWIVC